ncbi:MAG TPA: tRNA pseudouridine(38-40) synthase TruA [Planctomycetes bacterium]|nr:tRNA pseudouridine(38-40) synthase TruA [Planctomycetota bacterium]
MSIVRRVALLVGYDGVPFCGFQRQASGMTIQGALEDAWYQVSGEKVIFHGSGRTDSGVHAIGQVAHFSTCSSLLLERVMGGMNAYLSDCIAIKDAAEVPLDFHARHSATRKTYLYRIAIRSYPPALDRGRVGWERTPLKLDALRVGLRHLLGAHDFSAFAAAGGNSNSTERTIFSAHALPVRGGVNVIFQGDGFLYRQVRNMVGSLIEVGRGNRDPEWIAAVLDSRDRSRAGPTASAEGLYLLRVTYPTNPFCTLSGMTARSYPGSRI